MRVAMIGPGRLPVPNPGYGGAEAAIWELTRALRQLGVEVEIVGGSQEAASRGEWEYLRALPRRVQSVDADVVHVHSGWAGQVLAARLVDYVYTTHNSFWIGPLPFRRSLYHYRDRLTARIARVSVAMTPEIESVLRNLRLRRGRVVQIPIGVDTERYRSLRSPDPNVVIGVGIVHPRKRWHVAAQAVEGTRFRLTIVGPVLDAGYAEGLRRRGVHLTGYVPEADLLEWLGRAVFVIHPSEREILPAAVLQAMACERVVAGGRAIVSIPGTRSTPDEHDSQLVEYLHEVAQRYAHDPDSARADGLAARRIVERTYAWPAVARRHLDLYRTIADHSR